VHRGIPAASLLVLAIAALAPEPAGAQIVNVQRLLDEKKHEGFSDQFEGSLDLRAGNTQLLQLSASGAIQLREGPHLAFLNARYEFGRKNGADFLDRDFEHLRYRFDAADQVQLEVYLQHDRDQFRRLARRQLVGGGPRVHAEIGDWLRVAAGASYMYEYQRVADDGLADSKYVTYLHRLSFFQLVAIQLAERLRLSETTYFQPRIDAFSEIKILQETELSAAATPTVTLRMLFDFTYDAAPPLTVNPIDVIVKSVVALSF
jgi:hypothetical protein